MLLNKGVREDKILFLSLITAPEGIRAVCGRFPQVKIITSEIDDYVDEQYQVRGIYCVAGYKDLTSCAPSGVFLLPLVVNYTQWWVAPSL